MGIVINDIPYQFKDDFGNYDNIQTVVNKINDYLDEFDVSCGATKVYVDAADASRPMFSYVDASLLQRDISLNYLYNNDITKTYVDSSLGQRDVSLNYLYNNYTTKNYVDASLNVKANQTYVDASLNVKTNKTYVDGSLAISFSTLPTSDASGINCDTYYDTSALMAYIKINGKWYRWSATNVY